MTAPNAREEALFILALGKQGDEREAFLDRECSAEPELRERVRRLLEAHDRGDSLGDPLLRVSPTLSAGPTAGNPNDEAVGQLLGRYKLLERIGEGGYGTVYVADQLEPVRRRVALKIIKLGMDTRAVVARFEAERQALAMMDHPNVARIFDAGATASGRPFFVMELVRGIRITEYCDLHQLSTYERVTLFIKVCQAVQHAHQKGIIHRDLKPSNILVTLHDGVPVPKVIDFGIAKATEGRLTEATVYTQLHQFLGTPAYMSPEQAEMSGLDIDTRTDIYSLGVLLYELLTGQTPFDAKELIESGIESMRRTIREKEPARPSTRLSNLQQTELTTTAKRRSAEPPRLIHQLRGDLDWIVLKCLEKDRVRRYATANELIADLHRHIDNQPVLARPPTKLYRLQKAYQRHRLAFTAAAVVLVSLVTSLALVMQAAHRERSARVAEALHRRTAEDARAQAVEQAGLAQRRLVAALGLVENLMEDTLPELSELMGATRATESLVRSARGMIEAMNAQPLEDPQMRLHLANLNRILANVRGIVPGSSGLGDPESALPFAKEALQLLDRSPVQGVPESTWSRALFRAHLSAGYNLHALGRFEEARQNFEAALKLTAGSPDAQVGPDEARARMALGRVLRDLGKHQEALDEHFLPAYAAIHARVNAATNLPALDELRTLCLNIGDVYAWLGQSRMALPYSEEGLRLSESLAAMAPKSARAQVFSPIARAQLGKVLMSIGETDRARAALDESLATAERLAALDPDNAGMRWVLCYILGSHALAYGAWSTDANATLEERERRHERARAALKKAWEHLDALPLEAARRLPRHGLSETEARIKELRPGSDPLSRDIR